MAALPSEPGERRGRRPSCSRRCSTPSTCRPGWYPTFIDYLAFSFATATAFSPTDVSAVKPWAKALVVVESLLSLALATLVIARAINVLT